MTLRGLVYGTLPTASALFAPCRAAGVTADAVLRALRRLMLLGRHREALGLLHALGFTWKPLAGCTCATVPCLCDDVRAVAEALPFVEGEP